MSFLTDIIGDITGANDAADAAGAASATQAASAQAGIDESRRQFDKLVELMSPFVGAGTQSLDAQKALLGLSGGPAQQDAISAIEQSPQFGSLMQQGENALLQNASATGGLRGGNIQSALSKFRPDLLSQLIEQQLQRLGGVTTIGQNAAAGQGTAGINTGANIAQLLQQQGAATAGGQLAQGNARRSAFGDAIKIGGAVGGFF